MVPWVCGSVDPWFRGSTNPAQMWSLGQDLGYFRHNLESFGLILGHFRSSFGAWACIWAILTYLGSFGRDSGNFHLFWGHLVKIKAISDPILESGPGFGLFSA